MNEMPVSEIGAHDKAYGDLPLHSNVRLLRGAHRRINGI